MSELSKEILDTMENFIRSQFKKKRNDKKYKEKKENDPSIRELKKQYKLHFWINNRINIIPNIKASTHISKAIHPSSKSSNLYIAPSSLYKHNTFGTHVLGEDFDIDFSINARYLDIVNFFLLEIKSSGKYLYELLLDKNKDIIQTFNDLSFDEETVNKLCENLKTIFIQDNNGIKIDSYSKQLYWLTGNDSTNNEDYYLLVPFYPASLSHSIHTYIKNHISEYSDLVIYKIGGAQPQNISMLNKNRRGLTYLLPSLSPIWSPIDNMEIVIPYSKKSLFDIYKNRKDVWNIINEMNQDVKNMDDCIDKLIDHFIDISITYQDSLEMGWSCHENIEIQDFEKLWFDPYRSLIDNSFKENWLNLNWCDKIIEQFIQSIVSKLKNDIDDSDYNKWKDKLKKRRYWKERIKQLHKEIIKSK